ncbi:MAG: hypothetical protein C5B48_09055 [Candidatus Rokuibacteriota bacterium]|nr:MAG: hypothetical protein C5B48_09055 [Candidatus Rokubacteria bacterium]
MRVAALYDVHGNVHALEAVLAEVERERVDAIVFGGDIASGPFPRETLKLVRAVDAVCIRGNADRRDGAWGMDQWVWERLDPGTGAWLESLPEHAVLDGVLFCHATPRSLTEIVTPAMSDDRLAEILDGVEQSLVVAGHTHIQQDRRVGRRRFVNPGSVGRPFEDEPGAYWGIVGDEVDLRRTEFDLEVTAAATRGSGHPRAEELARENVLAAPGREQAIAEWLRLDAWVPVGRVGRPHGLDGAFVVEQASENPGWFEAGAELWVAGDPTVVLGSKRAGGRPVIELGRPVERGADLMVRLADLPDPGDDEYYAFQLVGLRVVQEDGRPLGRVVRVAPGVANDVLELDSGLSLPMVSACVLEVDTDVGRIVVAAGFAGAG